MRVGDGNGSGGGATAPKALLRGKEGTRPVAWAWKVHIGHMGQVRSQGEDGEVGGCCPRRAGSCGWCRKLKGSGEWAESRWERQCICWWPFVPGEEKEAALHREACSNQWAQDCG